MTADALPIADLLKKADDVAASIGYPDGSLRPEYHRQFMMLLSQAYDRKGDDGLLRGLGQQPVDLLHGGGGQSIG